MRKKLTPAALLIKRIRQQRGWSQQKLADNMGLSVKTIGRWERGMRVPRLQDYERILWLIPS